MVILSLCLVGIIGSILSATIGIPFDWKSAPEVARGVGFGFVCVALIMAIVIVTTGLFNWYSFGKMEVQIYTKEFKKTSDQGIDPFEGTEPITVTMNSMDQLNSTTAKQTFDMPLHVSEENGAVTIILSPFRVTLSGPGSGLLLSKTALPQKYWGTALMPIKVLNGGDESTGALQVGNDGHIFLKSSDGRFPPGVVGISTQQTVSFFNDAAIAAVIAAVDNNFD